MSMDVNQSKWGFFLEKRMDGLDQEKLGLPTCKEPKESLLFCCHRNGCKEPTYQTYYLG